MPLTTEDRLEIHELYARYCHAFDAGEAERWAAVFTPDGAFISQPGGPGSGLPVQETRGTASLIAFVHEHQRGLVGRTRHWVNEIELESTPTGAWGRVYGMVLLVGGGEPAQFRTTGRYIDELVRTADGWRFQSRTFQRDV